jgi:hypothetical protein
MGWVDVVIHSDHLTPQPCPSLTSLCTVALLFRHSRLASCKLAFPPYDVKQLEEIVTERINVPGAEGLISKYATQLAARKVSVDTVKQ